MIGEEETYGIIYKITNIVNKKVRIGQTTRTIEKRWKEYKYFAISGYNDHLSKAIRYYGEKKFIIEEIDRAHTQKELDEKEIYWIAHYDATNQKKGYNNDLGGLGGQKGEQTKIKISKSMKGKTKSESHKKKISKATKGRIHSKEAIRKQKKTMKGRIFSDEHRKNISNGMKGHKVSKATKEKIRKKMDGQKRTIKQREKYKKAQRERRLREKLEKKLNELRNNKDILKYT